MSAGNKVSWKDGIYKMSEKQENHMNLVLIRHGATASNKEHRYLGQTEESLSTEGTELLKKKKETRRYPKPDILFSSPMRRCLETAEILYPNKEAIVIPEWREMDFGEFEGKNYLELKDDKRYQAWIDSNGTLPFPGGESREQFVQRTISGLEQMISLIPESILFCEPENGLSRIPERERKTGTVSLTVAAIVHGGTIMALLSRLAGGEYFDYQVPNGAGYKCSLLMDKLRLVNLEKLDFQMNI